ncbi:pyridoxal phosphate-dependent decarboxylase family protein [Psychroflexus salis]|uniref:Pyridoxal-dependent decarboxylase n=1 Tax=Psychroflexus salis TaxID=1526574 RepID=A0A916ZSX0_9FLAO|nr:aminotransferase class V-fold PLP-dependent enzyme [Psychroflexus salis]GGE12574.1 pyridoxal-dependent decarboxylase [Psychroflexus salis]
MQEDLSLFHEIAEKLFTEEEKNPVVRPIPPDEVYDEFNLHLDEDGITENEFAELIEKVVLNTPRTSSKLFFNQLFGGRNTKATLGELLAVLLNTSMYTYKVGGPQVGIEKALLSEICNLINYPKNAGGTFAPGGSMSNFMALLMARDVANQHIKTEGVHQKMTLYTSAESHYSIQKNASFAGVGTQQIRSIQTDEFGKMIPAEFEKQVQQDMADGFLPFFVNITAGTTVLGAFDEIESLDAIAKKYKIWSHVDGAYCGAVLFSEKYKHLIKGVENVDSFSFNAHKMLNTPLSSSIIVTKNRYNLHHSFACDANYLYQTDGDDFNLGKTSLQCGRRNDALKYWCLWKSIGTRGLAKMVNHQFALAETARNYIKENDDYTLYSYDDSISICFNYKDIDPKVLCNLLYEEAKLMVGYGHFDGVDFIRLVTINSNNTDEEIENFFKVLEKFAK